MNPGSQWLRIKRIADGQVLTLKYRLNVDGFILSIESCDVINIVQISISSTSSPTDGCSLTLDAVAYSEDVTLPTSGHQIYNDIDGTSPFVGDGNFYKIPHMNEDK